MSPLRRSLLLAAVGAAAAVAGYFVNPIARQRGRVDIEALLHTALPDLGGQPRAVNQWRGKVLVVNFWATWCPPCLEEIPGFVRMQDRLGLQGLQFIGIAIDSDEKVREFIRAHGVNYPVLLGQKGGIELAARAGNVRAGLPYSVVLDRGGNVLAIFSGQLTESRLAQVIDRAL